LTELEIVLLLAFIVDVVIFIMILAMKPIVKVNSKVITKGTLRDKRTEVSEVTTEELLDVKNRSFQGIAFYIAIVIIITLVEGIGAIRYVSKLEEEFIYKAVFYVLIIAFLCGSVLVLIRKSSIFNNTECFRKCIGNIVSKKEIAVRTTQYVRAGAMYLVTVRVLDLDGNTIECSHSVARDMITNTGNEKCYVVFYKNQVVNFLPFVE